MTDLITRLREAKEGSRELDAEIAEHFGHKIEWKQANYVMTSYPVISWQAPDPYAGMREPCPQFTTDLSAAVALARRVFPKCWISLNELPDHAEADLAVNDHDDDLTVGCGEAPTAPLALCLAILTAKEDTDTNGGR